MSITITTKIDIVNRKVPPVINLSQYDSDFTLVFLLYASTGVFVVDDSTTAVIRGTKTSGNGYSASGVLRTISIAGISYTSVTITGDAQLTASAGKNIFEITLSRNGKDLSSANFIINVERAPLDANTITDETVLMNLDAIIQSAESARQSAESARQSAESARQSAESIDFGLDSVPTQGSTNAVSSGGVYEALADVNSDVADLYLRVEELEQGGPGGLSMTAVNLLNTILTEAVYGTDQTANIALLKKELSNIPPVSISAVLDGTALAGQSYSELSFIVTATFDDDSTQVVDNYTVVTTGTVTAGSNTATIRYRGITTTCTFTAEQVITYSITYNLTDVTSSNRATLSRENERYATEIAVVDSDHYISAFTVTMGGVDVTATVRNGNNIVIDAVTGNVVITIVANAYVYLDPLIVKRPYTTEGDSITKLYTDEYVTKASPSTIAYYHVGKVTEYPAKTNSTLNWTITNTSDSAVSLTNLGFGLIKDTTEYVNNNAIAYWQKIDNVGHSLEAGASLSGTYTMLAGWQLILTVTTNNINAISESISGDYIAEDFSEYTTYNITNADLTIKDPYKARTLYSDGGTEQLLSHTGYLQQYTTMDSPFVYDAYTRYVPINLSASPNISQNATGFVNDLSDENVYYAQKVADAKTQMSNLWRHITLKATDSSMIWIFTAKLGNQTIDNYSLTVKAKEVSA